MLELVLSFIHNAATLIFGVFISAWILGIRKSRKNLMLLLAFTFSVGALFIASFLSFGYDGTEKLYPLIIHAPLVLFFIFCFKRKASVSVLSVLTAYMFCQISNWTGLAAAYATHRLWAYYAVRIAVTLIVFILFTLFIANSFNRLLQKPTKAIVILSIMPTVYYVFDYLTCVYTDLLYSGLDVVVEFLGFVLCITFVLFLILYFKQYEEKTESDRLSLLLYMQQIQSQKEVERIRRSEREISILRHDMRHFLTNVSAFIKNGEYDKALGVIDEISALSDSTAYERYSNNKIIDLIVSSRIGDITEAGIELCHSIRVPDTLPCSDTDITSILSNALENAIHASKNAEVKRIELDMHINSDKLLISVKNTFSEPPRIIDGIPQTDKSGHGFGTQSIIHVTEKLGGSYQFSVKDGMFILRIII